MTTTAAPNNDEVAPREHPTLFLPDGDVVLSVKSHEPARTLYRLEKSLLSHHSPIFRSTFRLPQQPGLNEEYQGVPVVPLEENDPGAMEDLLKFMQNPAYVRSQPRYYVLAP